MLLGGADAAAREVRDTAVAHILAHLAVDPHLYRLAAAAIEAFGDFRVRHGRHRRRNG